MKKFGIARRSFLKGAGVSILLPALDIMVHPRTAAAAGTSPRYAAFFLSLGMWGRGYDPTKNNASRYFDRGVGDASNGVGAWRPAQAGALSGPLPVHLAPFEALKQKMMIVSGLSTLTSESTGIEHSLATTCWLTSPWKTKSIGNNITNTPPNSVDQYIANAMGFTPGSTIAFNPSTSDFSEPNAGGHGGYISSNALLGGNHLVPKIANPMKVFTQLFGKCSTAAPAPNTNQDDKSVLDYVMGSVNSLQKNLGKDDKTRLDAYLQNIRDVEKNLTAAAPVLCPTTPPAYDPPLSGGALDWLATLRMMVDVVALAMASDAMPIATIMSDTEANGAAAYAARVAYGSDFVGVGGQKVTYSSNSLDTHFDITHNSQANNTSVVEQWFAYTRMLMHVAHRLAQKLDSFPMEPNGNTPLDNSILQIGCAHGHSADHSTRNIPTILLGGKKFKMRQGQAVQLPMGTDIGNFYHTMLRSMQMPGTDFNGHNTLLSGLFG